MNENLTIHTSTPFGSGEVTTDKTVGVATVATFGADTLINVSTCDVRPGNGNDLDEITRNAVRLTIHSSYWGDDGEIRVDTVTAITPAQALSLAQRLISQATAVLEAK